MIDPPLWGCLPWPGGKWRRGAERPGNDGWRKTIPLASIGDPAGLYSRWERQPSQHRPLAADG